MGEPSEKVKRERGESNMSEKERSMRNSRTGDKKNRKRQVECAGCERRECDRVTRKEDKKKKAEEKKKLEGTGERKRRECDNVTEKMKEKKARVKER